jgi:hypothetical protein
MPVTITAGITFSGGGLTMEFAPPSQATAGWWAGGSPSTSTVQRITFATDTATATGRGPLNGPFYGQGSTGTFTYGWYAGGFAPGGVTVSKVDRITYATDTDTASVRGTLDRVVYNLAAVTTDTYGWFGGGYNVSNSPVSSVSRITYATDTSTATGVGPLSAEQGAPAATGTNTYGWFAGGFAPGPARVISIVSRITYVSDTNTASVRGPLSQAARGQAASTDSTTYGWFGGGYIYIGPPFGQVTSGVERITYATDTVTARVRGPLTVARQLLSAAGNSTDGWFGAGNVSGGGGNRSTVDRITYATDTATASVRGTLIQAINTTSTTSGVQ